MFLTNWDCSSKLHQALNAAEACQNIFELISRWRSKVCKQSADVAGKACYSSSLSPCWIHGLIFEVLGRLPAPAQFFSRFINF